MPATFPYRIGRWSRYVLLAWGVRAGHREVVVDDDRLLSRFGWVTAQVPLADIERWDITGPYHWFRAIGTTPHAVPARTSASAAMRAGRSESGCVPRGASASCAP